MYKRQHFIPQKWGVAIIRYWGRSALFMMRIFCGLKTEFHGLDKLPQGGVFIASKHQSYFDIFALLAVVPNSYFVSKQQLLDIPLFGYAAKKYGVIGIDRSKGKDAMNLLRVDAVDRLKSGANIIIYPEGTRRAPDAEPKYKNGLARLYKESNFPILPIGLNSGHFWPPRKLFIKAGTARIMIGNIIEPGLELDEVQQLLIQQIEKLSTDANEPQTKEALAG